MKKTFGDWYLGLDVGTDSIGWAVTDKNYHIQKLNSKALWGSRLFPEAKPAAERRIFRSARRRNQRATQRIKWLQELFSQEICKVDPGFFQRMKESFFWEEDKTEHQKFSLFNDNTYTDKNYFKQFPTIYHLRAALLDPCQGPFDIRLVYLALHHIIKNRGHFLFDGDMESAPSFKPIFKEIVEYFQNLQEEETAYSFPEESIHQVGLLLSDRSLNRLEKSSKLMELLQVDKSNKSFKTLIEAMVGRKFSLSALFDDENLQNSECNKLCFADGNFADEKIPLLETELDEDRMYLVEKMFAAYDWALLADILDGQHFLSQAKVLAYKEHARQLKELKKVIKEYAPQKYNEVFRSPSQKDNYCCYIGSTMINAKKLSIEKKCNYDDFSKYIKTIIDNIAKTQNGCIDKNVQELLSLIERRELLPKLVTKDNCVIPHQLNCLELKAILKNASNYLPFLNEKDKEGLSVQEKIVSILNYRIPYFVGPLNGSHAQDTGRKFYWACKNSNDRIFPWNFNKVVNLEESAENFILRMTNKCTYLKGEDVLPKESLLYSKFTVLNELNNLRLDGEPITVALKQEIFLNLFLKEKKVTQKKLRNFLHINDNVEISGIDNDFKSSLKPYLDFAQYHDFSKQGDINNRLTEEQIENIIRWIVLFGNEKKILRAKIQKTYPETRFTSADIQYLSSLHYQKWGNFSASFLNLCAPDPHTSMEVSLVDMLWETNNNLMQLLGNDYSYSSMIEEFNNEEPLDKLSYSVVEELQVSPVVKRQIWQTLVIVRELTKVMGHAPLKVFVEMARKKDKKKLRKDPRKDKLKKLYEKCKEENAELLESLNQQPDGNLQQDALYLYYTQMGKCMYSGESIELEDLLSNSHIYDIDHIYPQSLVKDDSLDNRVLVKKTLNGIKSDDYPLSLDCQRKMFLFWKMLREKELISKEKFDRLTRTTELTSDELAGFIQRQLVETRQSTKAIANILKRFFADKSEIIYVKAGLVSDFRKAPPTGKEIKNGYSEEEIKKDALLKVREVNDLHHAKDAYLNIVVGNVYNTKFTSNPYNFINNAEKKRSYNLKRMFDFEVKRGDYSAWVPGVEGTCKLVMDTMLKNNILFTRYASTQRGGLFDQMIVKKGTNDDLFPIKGKIGSPLANTQRYGGYNKTAGAYFMLVEHLEKKEKVRSFEFVPLNLQQYLEESKEHLLQYCIETLHLIKPRILLSRVYINSLLLVDGYPMHIAGRTGNQLSVKGACQLVISQEMQNYLHNVVKYRQKCIKQKKQLSVNEYDGITKEKNLWIYEELVRKHSLMPYKNRPASQASLIAGKIEQFQNLSEDSQCIVLLEVLKLFQTTGVTSDFSLFNEGKKKGYPTLGKKLNQSKTNYLIFQSPTGIFEKEVNLLTL